MCPWQDIQYCLGSARASTASSLQPGQAPPPPAVSAEGSEGQKSLPIPAPTFIKAINQELNREKSNSRKDAERMGEAGRQGQKRTGKKPVTIQLSPKLKKVLLESKRLYRKIQTTQKPSSSQAVFPQFWPPAPNYILKLGEVVTSSGQ